MRCEHIYNIGEHYVGNCGLKYDEFAKAVNLHNVAVAALTRLPCVQRSPAGARYCTVCKGFTLMRKASG
jgi:hypothetical protein